MKRAEPYSFIKNATQLIFYGTMTGTYFNSTFSGFALLNRRMPKGNTVLLSDNDLFEP